ncbi:MAG: hypothetical protein H8E98_02615 [Bacteroidetes bacterium]|nr:hypothetical protein [Bacteroidota bacterium]
MQYIPLNGNVIIQTGTIEEKLGDTGLIKAVGPTNKVEGIIYAIADDVTKVKVGDRVYYGAYGNVQQIEPTTDLWVTKESDLVAIIGE